MRGGQRGGEADDVPASGPVPAAAPGPAEADADAAFMAMALEEARAAGAVGEVPVGAVAVLHGRVLSRAHNRRETSADPTAHAEILALREAASRLASWRLDDVTLYATLEPCFMCAGAMVNARVSRLVFGAADPKAGAVGSLGDVARDARLNHRLEVRSGVLADACGAVLKQFFATRRGGGDARLDAPGDGP